MKWMLMPLRRYAEFSGRSRRKEYSMFALGLFLLYFVMVVVIFATVGDEMGAPVIVFGVIELGLIIPSIAVTVRRLHDIDYSGWWAAVFLLTLVFWVGAIPMLVLMVLPGTKGLNRYGDDPITGTSAEIFA